MLTSSDDSPPEDTDAYGSGRAAADGADERRGEAGRDLSWHLTPTRASRGFFHTLFPRHPCGKHRGAVSTCSGLEHRRRARLAARDFVRALPPARSSGGFMSSLLRNPEKARRELVALAEADIRV